MHPAALLLLVGVPIGIGIAVLATRSDEPVDDVELPEDVIMLRTVGDMQRYAQQMRGVAIGDLSGIGIVYRKETTPLRAAVASVAQSRPDILFVVGDEEVFDAVGGEAAGINLHCGEQDAGVIAAERKGTGRVGHECWAKGITASEMRESVGRMAAKI